MRGEVRVSNMFAVGEVSWVEVPDVLRKIIWRRKPLRSTCLNFNFNECVLVSEVGIDKVTPIWRPDRANIIENGGPGSLPNYRQQPGKP
jgi:hypothetical protein